MLFNEPKLLKSFVFEFEVKDFEGFSALQRAEIAEISVLRCRIAARTGFSALQRAEIAEIRDVDVFIYSPSVFQCSSTSRNC